MPKLIYLFAASLLMLSQLSSAGSKDASSEELPSLTPSQLAIYNQLADVVMKGDVKAAKSILKSNPGLLGVDDERDFNLMALAGKSPEMANLLLDNHVLINWVPPSGMTLLMGEIVFNQPEIALRMIEMGADLSNALMAAVGSCNLKITDALLTRNVDVKAKAPDGSTALHIALDSFTCGSYVPKYRATTRAQLVKKLLDKGADVNVANKSGDTPLSVAKKNNDAEMIKLLQEAGAK